MHMDRFVWLGVTKILQEEHESMAGLSLSVAGVWSLKHFLWGFSIFIVLVNMKALILKPLPYQITWSYSDINIYLKASFALSPSLFW